MKKRVLRIASVCAFATLYFGSPSAHAFCTHFEIAGIGVNCVDEGHKKVTGYLGPFMRPEIWSVIWNGNYAQDNPFGSFANDGQRHFQSCLFRNKPYVVANIHYIDPGSIEYIRDTYSNAIAYLNPLDPEPLTAADRFGKLLHTVQDFYSHTNWINLLYLSAPNPVSSADLFENTLGEWPLIDWLGPVRDDIILGQVPANGFLPAGWSVTQSETSEIPIFTTPDGPRRGLITGWNETGACPDVREGLKVDDYSHLEILPIPRTNRLPHGESKIAGQTDFVHEITDGWKDAGYQAERPCHDGYPTYVCLQKDTPGRPDYGQAIQLAKLQTAQEWCRLLHLTKDSWGYSGTSILMTLWGKPADEPFGPQDDTACGTPPEVLAGKAGPIEVTVDPTDVSVHRAPVPDGSPGGRTAVFAVYTGDFRRSSSRQGFGLTDDQRVHTESITMCVKPTDKLVAAIWGWDDFNDDPYYPTLSPTDRVVRGPTWVLDGPGFQPESPYPPENDQENQDMDVSLYVHVGGEDPDGDGLSTACGEVFYGTDPVVADTDQDGLNDGDEVNTNHTDPLDTDTDNDDLTDGDEVNTYGTDPRDADTDDDELTDGAEVNTHGTDPVNPDSDGDGLTDGAEVNTHHTDPNHPDTDRDGLPDGIEVKYGTNPLLSDTDGDGLPDGQDVEWIEDVIAGIPDAAIKSPAAGNRNAMLNLLEDAEALLLKSNRRAALDKLMTLRKRNDGCGVVPDGNDWIVDCAVQTEIRMLIDLLIANVST